MELTADIIAHKMKNIDDFKTKVLIVRLFDEYKKIESSESEEVDLVKLKTALENLDKGIGQINFENSKYLSNEKILKEIKEDFLKLKIHIQNFNKKNKEQAQEIMDIITRIECLLKLPITFKSNIGDMLERMLNYEESKIKRGLCL